MNTTAVPMTLIASAPAVGSQVGIGTGEGGGAGVDPYSKDAINQLFRRQPQRFKFVSKFNAKSVSWKDFELVYLDNRLKDFARCVHCKSFVTYSSKKGTGGMLRHRCVGKDGPVATEPPAKKISLAPKPLTFVTAPRRAGQQPAGQLCTLLNIPSHPGQPGNIQTIIYNPDQGNVLNLQNLTKLGLAVQTVKTASPTTAIPAATAAAATATTTTTTTTRTTSTVAITTATTAAAAGGGGGGGGGSTATRATSATSSLAPAAVASVSITKIEPQVKEEVAATLIKTESVCLKEVPIKEEHITEIGGEENEKIIITTNNNSSCSNNNNNSSSIISNINDESSNDDIEQIVSNVELNEDISYGAPSCDSDDEGVCQPDTRNPDYGLISAPAEVQLADLQVKHEIEQHNAKMAVFRRQLEVADLQKEFWRTKLKALNKNSKASEDDGIHSDD